MDIHTHNITYRTGGHDELGWRQPVCSCGWEGSKHYAYNDYQLTNARGEAEWHTRMAMKPTV